MSTLLKPFTVREKLRQTGLLLFTPAEFELVFKVSSVKAKYFLEAETRRGFLLRLKKGLYTLATDLPGEEQIANRLYKPSYLSFEYALAYHNILPEMTYTVTSATTKPTRNFTVDSKVFSFLTIKTEAYTGYRLVKNEKGSFLLAEPEKALIDYLYFVTLGKKTVNDRLRTKELKKEKLLFYAKLYQRKKLDRLIRELR